MCTPTLIPGPIQYPHAISLAQTTGSNKYLWPIPLRTEQRNYYYQWILLVLVKRFVYFYGPSPLIGHPFGSVIQLFDDWCTPVSRLRGGWYSPCRRSELVLKLLDFIIRVVLNLTTFGMVKSLALHPLPFIQMFFTEELIAHLKVNVCLSIPQQNCFQFPLTSVLPLKLEDNGRRDKEGVLKKSKGIESLFPCYPTSDSCLLFTLICALGWETEEFICIFNLNCFDLEYLLIQKKILICELFSLSGTAE